MSGRRQIKSGPQGPRQSAESSRLANFCRLLALGGVSHLENDFVALFEGLEAFLDDLGEVGEKIWGAVIGRDESEAFCVVEPFYCACRCHDVALREVECGLAPLLRAACKLLGIALPDDIMAFSRKARL